MKFFVLCSFALAVAFHCATGVPQGYGSSSSSGRHRPKCKTIYDVEYVEKYDKKCHTEYE